MLILKPSIEERRKWGILAYVDETERNRILFLPHGETKKAIKALEKEIKIAKNPKPKVSIVEYKNYTNIKPQQAKETSYDEPEHTEE